MQEYMNTLRSAYDAGVPLISDTEYDALEKLYGQELGASGDVPHRFRMWSLNKHFMRDGAMPLNESECVESPKLDGTAVGLTYVNGKLVQALTRGDGHKGRCILSNMKHLVPNTMNSTGVLQITGEVVALSSIKNSRNYASGAVNLKDEKEFIDRVNEGSMVFVAYGVQFDDDFIGVPDSSYESDMAALATCTFVVITEFDHELYPKDGTVFRINDNNKYNQAGFTSKFPHGAIAVKESEEEFTTIIREVVWDTGKTGKVTPVAIYDPIDTGDAILTRATLNNVGYIRSLNLEIGCTVVVVRAGDIIPRIIRRVD